MHNLGRSHPIYQPPALGGIGQVHTVRPFRAPNPNNNTALADKPIHDPLADEPRRAGYEYAVGRHRQRLRLRCRSASTISRTISSMETFGSQPSARLAFAGFPNSTSTSAGLKKAGSTFTY